MEREREQARETLIFFCSMYVCIHWLLLVHALTRDQPTTLAYWDDTLTN